MNAKILVFVICIELIILFAVGRFSICLILEEKFADDTSAQFYFLPYYRPENESRLRKSLVYYSVEILIVNTSSIR